MRGKNPISSGFDLVCTKKIGNNEWDLYTRKRPDFEWMDVKLICKSGRPNKRLYRTAYSEKKLRFAFNNDMQKMIYSAKNITEFMCDYFSVDYKSIKSKMLEVLSEREDKLNAKT